MSVDLTKVIEALRNELQQYGEMLALLDHQQELVKMCGADDILHSIAAINAQSATIQGARERRENLQRELAADLGQPEDATFAVLLPLLPEHYRPLLGALVQENNELLDRVRRRAGENQSVLLRSIELMQRFITTLSPESGRQSTQSANSAVLAMEPGSPIYDAIV
jgi:FlgN protein